MTATRARQREETRLHLVETALDLFATKGYASTSIHDVLDATGLSRGALYHHFASKEALFVAVLVRVESSVVDRLAQAAARAPSPLEAVVAGCCAFLRLATDPVVARIVLVDAPVAVGWEEWRRIDEEYAFGLLKTGVSACVRDDGARSELVAHAILAALLELALVLARSPRKPSRLREAEATISGVVRALLG